MVKVFSCGQMAQNTQETSLTTTSKEKESMNGLTEDNMKVNGKTIKCTVKVFLHGETEGDMKVTTSMIKRKVLVCLNGQMDVNI